jgi:hypothetical protein
VALDPRDGADRPRQQRAAGRRITSADDAQLGVAVHELVTHHPAGAGGRHHRGERRRLGDSCDKPQRDVADPLISARGAS